MPEKFENIYGALEQGVDVNGAMVCDYRTFRSLYNHAVRASVRNNREAVISMLKIVDVDEPDKNTTIDISNRIGTAIAGALRRDDVVTGFDTNQFLILLAHLSMEDARKVLDRLISRITDELSRPIKVEIDLERVRQVP